MALDGKEGIQFELNYYEHVNSTRKLTIVAEIVSLLKKIYKRDGPLRAVFKVKTLAVLFPPYPLEMKTNTAILALVCFYRNGATHSHARSIARAWLKHAHSFDRCGGLTLHVTDAERGKSERASHDWPCPYF